MTWEKVNLVTQRDGSDLYRCSECSYEKKYFGFNRDRYCPKCGDGKPTAIFGYWTSKEEKDRQPCNYCGSPVIECPKEGNPNSRFWELQRFDTETLVVCPRGCLEDGSYVSPTISSLQQRIINLERRVVTLKDKIGE